MYHIIPVDRMSNSKPANLFLMGRPDLLYAFTKLALWRQTQYSKIVYIDADIVALRNLDDLFETKANFAAAPDIGWPDAFNSGLMVLTPDMGDFWAMQALAQSGDSFDGADQGLLNQYYEHRPWQRLSFTYNCTPSAEYQWEPAYRYHKSNIKAVHFIGKDKPWFVGRQAGGGQGTYGELVGKWWSVYDRHYRSVSPSSDIASILTYSISHPNMSLESRILARLPCSNSFLASTLICITVFLKTRDYLLHPSLM